MSESFIKMFIMIQNLKILKPQYDHGTLPHGSGFTVCHTVGAFFLSKQSKVNLLQIHDKCNNNYIQKQYFNVNTLQYNLMLIYYVLLYLYVIVFNYLWVTYLLNIILYMQ